MIDFSAIRSTAAAAVAPTSAAAKEARPQAQVWLNVGIPVDVVNDKGETETVFLSLPLGLPLDTMEEQAMKGNSPAWHNMVQAKNVLLNQLKEAATGIAPGGELIIDGLQIQLKRVGDKVAPAPGENPLLAAMQAKLQSAQPKAA